MSELSQLSPSSLWQFFAQICAIPHPSYHEEALAQHILQWAKENNIHAERDETGNLLLRKAATPGMEKRKPVTLQAHLDMVPQKNEETSHDFTTDAIQPYIDGEWVKAKGTTLGADNGIGMASALAVLAGSTIKHGPLEVLLTMTEEAGMDGAFGLKPGWLKGDILINTDSETEGEIYMGCAGGIDVITTLPLNREAVPVGYVYQKITLKGIKGGHSGCDIHKGQGNANKLLARFLAQPEVESLIRLAEFRGGTLRNAIPREAFALVAVQEQKLSELTHQLSVYLETIKHELQAVEPNLNLLTEESALTSPVLDKDSQVRFLSLLNSTPNGVIRMSDAVPGVVETSLNVGVISMTQEQAEIICLVRSLVDSSKEDVVNTLQSLGTLAGARVEPKGGYPGWQPDAHSPVMALTQSTYKKLFGKDPQIMVIHAGLECGLFKQPYPHMDMVSIGPTIVAPHSPDERVHIESVEKYWQLLTALLENIPQHA